MSGLNSFFAIYTGVLFTLYSHAVSHEFNRLNIKIDYLTQETQQLKNLYNENIIEKSLDKYKI
jgi:hypothetical protein